MDVREMSAVVVDVTTDETSARRRRSRVLEGVDDSTDDNVAMGTEMDDVINKSEGDAVRGKFEISTRTVAPSEAPLLDGETRETNGAAASRYAKENVKLPTPPGRATCADTAPAETAAGALKMRRASCPWRENDATGAKRPPIKALNPSLLVKALASVRRRLSGTDFIVGHSEGLTSRILGREGSK